jgi:hypothetical protein
MERSWGGKVGMEKKKKIEKKTKNKNRQNNNSSKGEETCFDQLSWEF